MLGNTKRVELLRRLRAQQRLRHARDLTPAERLAIARRIHQLSVEVGTSGRHAGGDEPASIWLALVAHLRESA